MLAAEGAASKAQQEMERLQQQVETVEQQLEAAKETAAQRKAAERDVESNLEDAKAQLQVCGGGGVCWASATARITPPLAVWPPSSAAAAVVRSPGGGSAVSTPAPWGD
jgi:hypothetical protein